MSSTYYTNLALASLVAAFSLVQDSVEGVVASMLISPVGMPLLALAPAICSGDKAGGLAAAVTLAVSVPIMMALGACVRAWHGGREASGEMRKRTATFQVRNVLAYAMLIGAAMAASSPGDTAVRATGLAIAISILPPIVNAGILAYDAVHAAGARKAKAQAEAKLGAQRSGTIALLNIGGVVLSSIVLILFKVARRK